MEAKNCECCFMPMSEATRAKGSDRYCSYCFVEGQLLADNLSLKEFQKKSFEGMVDNGFSRFMAFFATKMIRFAPYWKQRRAK